MVRSVSLPPLPPTLELDGLRLRPLRPQDAAPLYSYLADPAVIAHTSFPVLEPEAVALLVDRFMREALEGRSCRWALVLPAQDQLIGTCGFNTWSTEHAWAELAYDLAQAHWGSGLMSQAVAAALHWAFVGAGFNRVHAFVMTSNRRSAALLERLGFTSEGTLKEFRVARGVPRDFFCYCLLRSEWQARVTSAASIQPLK